MQHTQMFFIFLQENRHATQCAQNVYRITTTYMYIENILTNNNWHCVIVRWRNFLQRELFSVYGRIEYVKYEHLFLYLVNFFIIKDIKKNY